MRWKTDLLKDIRTNSPHDDVDGGHRGGCSAEVSECNRKMVLEKFNKIKDRCQAILEIGIYRNGPDSFTQVFLKNKLPSTKYLGVDLRDVSVLNDPTNNVYTVVANSSDYESVVNYSHSIGISQYDFIFIDGNHCINQVLKDWEYVNLLSEDGIVGFHDTAYHFGPKTFLANLDFSKWNIVHNACAESEDDYGVGFVWKRKQPFSIIQ